MFFAQEFVLTFSISKTCAKSISSPTELIHGIPEPCHDAHSPMTTFKTQTISEHLRRKLNSRFSKF